MVGHGSPGVVLGGGLGVPHITSISSQVAGLKSLGNCIRLTDFAPGCVDQVGALGHLGNHFLVEKVLRTLHRPVVQVRTGECYWVS